MGSGSESLEHAALVLRDGGVVAHACEGVWGLACDPWNKQSVERVAAIKERGLEKGLILIAASSSDFKPELGALTERSLALVLESWPGNQSWVVESARFPDWITGGRDSVAVRVPGSTQARSLAHRFGGPLVSTSANKSGLPPALTEAAVRLAFEREVDYILPGDITGDDGHSRLSVAATGERLR